MELHSETDVAVKTAKPLMDLDGITLRAWTDAARPGEQRVYHLGFLARAENASRLAAVAHELHRAGKVSLVQRRIAVDVYAYIAKLRADEIAVGV